MEYKTSKEMSTVWGITPKRINVLAKQGRIKGAELIGNTWMIPLNSEKPSDRRYKENKKEESIYKFPLFICRPAGNIDFVSKLNIEEKRCLNAEKKFHANKMMEAYDTFLDLYQNSKYSYIRINALYHLSFTNLLNQNFDKYMFFYDALSKEIDVLKDNHKELLFIKRDLDSLIRGNINLFNDANPLDEISYDPDNYQFITVSIFLNNLSNVICGIGNNDLTLYEFVIQSHNPEYYPYITCLLHVLLAMTYFLMGDKENNIRHCKIATEIAYKHKVYNSLCVYYTYIKNSLDPILKEYPQNFQDIIYEGNKLYINAINGVAKHFNGDNIPTLLSSDVNYIGYAIRKMSNKEIAYELNISEAAVSKKYQTIFEKFNVSGKEELIKKISKSISNPYLLGV